MIATIALHDEKFAYTDSIANLRSLLAMRGGRTGYLQLDLVLDKGGRPEAHLLMARESLYIDAFRSNDGVWHYFKDSKGQTMRHSASPAMSRRSRPTARMVPWRRRN